MSPTTGIFSEMRSKARLNFAERFFSAMKPTMNAAMPAIRYRPLACIHFDRLITNWVKAGRSAPKPWNRS